MEYHRPATLDAALELLSGPAAQPLAGGTHIALAGTDARSLVDLRDLGLDGVSGDGEWLRIGAMTTLGALADAAELPAVLRRAAVRGVPPNLRTLATLGGALAGGAIGPLAVTLLALAARVHFAPGAAVETLEDYLARKRTGEADPRLITALSVQAGRQAGYAEIARTPADLPLLCAAVSAFVAGGRASEVRWAAGAEGQPWDCGRLQRDQDDLQRGSVPEAVASMMFDINWVDDLRAGAAYRRAQIPVLVRRALESLFDDAEVRGAN